MALAPIRPFVGGGVEIDHDLVDEGLFGGVVPDHRRSQDVIDVRYGLGYALPGVAIAPVAELDRLERPGRGAGGHGGPAHGATGEDYLGLHGRVAA